MKTLHRFAARLAALALALCLLAAAAPAAFADAGDYDRINEYTVTVDLRADGSADITYAIDWQVIGGGAEDALTWVRVGLANRYADELTVLTPDTVADLTLESGSGAWARVQFLQEYYAPAVAQPLGLPDRVQFAFRVHQSHLFTLNDDGSADFAFTPGWFDDLNVQHLTVRWRDGAGFAADNTGTDGDYLTWEYGPLDHGEAVTVRVTVPLTQAADYDPTLADTGAGGGADREAVLAHLVLVLLLFLVLAAVILLLAAQPPRWGGGFGGLWADDWLWYSNGIHTIRCARGVPPPSGYRAAQPPAGFRPGGGHSRGGGAGRRSGGGCASSCACACASSCACACACAGGGRAGCSAKDFYRVTLPAAAPETTEGRNEP